ncbi:MAG: cyclic-di-AMP receptor [Candidatus Pelethousia sp.]|nr:cyclic-di-AMP receptor [Candidatus Pelethousia sp.]
MKLIFAIVQNDDSKRLIRDLTNRHISVTRISSTGGFLHGGNSTLMIGVEKDKLQETLDVIKEKSSTRKEYMVIPTSLPGYVDNAPTPVQVTLGGATVFVVDVDEHYRF